jgi:hypothetical protein
LLTPSAAAAAQVHELSSLQVAVDEKKLQATTGFIDGKEENRRGRRRHYEAWMYPHDLDRFNF